jgi:hypothetical protein
MRAAVVPGFGQPFIIEARQAPEPGPGQVVVRTRPSRLPLPSARPRRAAHYLFTVRVFGQLVLPPRDRTGLTVPCSPAICSWLPAGRLWPGLDCVAEAWAAFFRTVLRTARVQGGQDRRATEHRHIRQIAIGTLCCLP